MTNTPRKGGRPVGSGFGRTRPFKMWISPEEEAEMKRRAAAAGMTLSEYVRQRALADERED